MRERVVGLREEDEEDIWTVAGLSACMTVVGRHAGVCLVSPARRPLKARETVGGHAGSGNHHVGRLRDGGRNGEPGERLSGPQWAFRLAQLARPRRSMVALRVVRGQCWPMLPMTCSGVFRRLMFVAHYVHGVRFSLFWKSFPAFVTLGSRAIDGSEWLSEPL